jgi:hypothetical protein
MPLVDLKTNLKSLKYGLDRPDMGSSREPFITKPIPDEIPPETPDFILRDGALRRGVEDVSRLTKLFTTFRGLKFLTNTNLLSRTSVKTEASLGPAYGGGNVNQGIHLPTSTLAQVGVNALGTHLNLLGLNPTIPMAGIIEGGLFQNGGLINYEQAAFEFNKNNLNRLVKLKEDKIDLDPNSTELFLYSGGPGSILGVGKTFIKRSSNTTGINSYGNPESGYKELSKIRTNNSKTSLNLTNLLGASNEYFTYSEISGIQIPDPSSEILGVNFENGSQLKNFGPQDNNKTLSVLEDSDQLISDSLSKSKAEVANSKSFITGNKLLGASNIEGISNESGFNDEGQQVKLYGPQDGNVSLSKDTNSNYLISSSLETSKNTVSLTSLSHYTKLLGVSKVYDSGQGRPDAPFSQPGEDKSGFNEEGQQLKRYGPSDQNKLNDGHGDRYRYEWTPSKREDKDASIYEVGRQGKIDMFADPNTNQQTFFPNYKVLNSPFTGEDDFNTIRNQKDLFNRYNTGRLNSSSFGNGQPKVLTQYLNGADGRSGTNSNDSIDGGQLFPFILNLINAQSPGVDQYLYWQAYVNSFSDKISVDHDSYNYPGYGTDFYKYKSFKRSISLDFTIEVPNPKQMGIIYLKLQELIRHLAPNYSSNGFLRGNFVKLTFGDYVYDTPCILNGFNLEPEFDAGFDIGRTAKWASRGDTSGYRLPKVIKVSGFDFTVLADNNNNIMDGTSTFISNNKNLLG